MRAIWGIVLFAAACGDDSSGDPAAVCGSGCGRFVNEQNVALDCALCRYDLDVLDPGAFPSAVGLAGDTVVFDGTIASRGTPWTLAPIDNAPGAVGDVAIAPDGSPWVVSVSAGAAQVGHLAAGAWTWEPIDANVFSDQAAIAVAADGTPFVALGGDTSTGLDGMLLAHRDASGWTIVSLASGLSPSRVAIAKGATWVAWHDDETMTIKAAEVATGSPEVVDPSNPGGDDLAVVTDAAGAPHVLYLINVPLDRVLLHGARDASGAWTIEQAVQLPIASTSVLRAAIGPDDEIAVAYIDDHSLRVSARTGGRWFTQIVNDDCDGGVGVDFSAAGKLDVAAACRNDVRVIERNGETFPADYTATCAAIGAAVCPVACSCGGSDCCVDGSGGSHCSNPESFCEQILAEAACGDATADPQVASDCEAAVAAPVCDGSGSGVTLPAACSFDF